MLVSTVKQVLKADDGDALEAFKGQVKTVWKRRTGTSDGGRDWAVQNLLCREGESTVEVVLWNQEPIRADAVGETIYITADGGEGLEAVDHEWKGKTKRQVKVSQACTVSRADPSSSTANQSNDGPANNSKPMNKGQHSYIEAHLLSGRAANAMLLAWKAATHVASLIEKDSKLFATPELITAMTIRIYGSLEQRGMIEAMPIGNLPKKGEPVKKAEPAPEPEPEPEPEAEADPPTGQPETSEMDDVPF